MPEAAAGAADPATLDLLADLIDKARAAGADAADALAVEGTSLSLAQRLGKPERLERSEGLDLGLRVFVGRRVAVVSSSDRKPDTLAELVERALAMAKTVPEDPFAGLADPDAVTASFPDLDLVDPTEPAAKTLMARAAEAEEAALAVAGVTNSEGAESGYGLTRIALVASNGFAGGYTRTGSSLAVSVIAGEGTGMETDYDFTSAVHGADLEAAAEVGRRAGAKAVARLGARKVPTGKVPIVFAPRVANGFLRTLAGAISGPAVARGTSFLKDRMGEAIFAPGVTIVDDPLKHRGLRSKPFDGEGLAPHRRAVIEDGKLTTWLLDLRSARQLGLGSTGHASRGTTGQPSPAPTNLWMEPGRISPEQMIAEIDQGFFVTQMMGQGTNMVTGDYSRGATGFWIENGAIAYPVSEVTVAGNLKDMFRAMTPADDLSFKFGIDAPTLRVDGMTVAGK
ncbi:MAG: TldD/PmbA family protein [Alphaproteobacteria bacterium]|jgi:PmbA protein|nr:TldD/PmbA family protein [Alphaproteobacteria bacterium]